MSEPRHLNVIVVPDGGRESRTYSISYRRLRLLTAVGLAIVVVVAAMAGSWWYLAARAMRVDRLEERLATMAADQQRVEQLALELEGLEEQYSQIRGLFDANVLAEAPDLWLPPSALARAERAGTPARSDDTRPTSWPLTERGFVTQTLMEGDSEHAGVDIAVPSDAYVRAAGPGTVVDVGEDQVYGRFVLLDHGDGFHSRYAHASTTFVERGQSVRRNEVIALTGSTGQSTAPHLHFEVLVNGEPVDPLTVAEQP
ncbi:MAG: M23 family metallopeptidase [Gemmatimonadota bacterium]|nr:M23 family metallopeptidase [Gemmatimonadota bacterium]